MIRLRVTKYDPANRDKEGKYLADEWTSVGDIGKKFGGRVFSENDYLAVEASYVAAIKDLLKVSRSRSLRIVDFEECSEVQECPIENTHALQQASKSISSGAIVTDKVIEAVVRLALREVIWCKLHGGNGTYVHFGYDYYMYVGTDSENAAMPMPPSGLYYEVFESPYAV